MKRFAKGFFIILIMLGMYHFLWVLDTPLAGLYDIFSGQKSPKKVSFEGFKTLRFEELPTTEQEKYQNPTCKTFSYEKAKFLKISWFERYKDIAENAKVYQFLTPDRLIRNRVRIPNLSKTQYLLIEEKVLKVYQNLIYELQENGYDVSEITVASALRNPKYNKMVSGSSCSQHQIGNAIDISVGDINGDGVANTVDKEVVYAILEDKLIQNEGGIGVYPNYPRVIHFDTRGHRARWY